MADDGIGVEIERLDDGIDQRRRIFDPHAERVAGFVIEMRAFEREFEVAHVPVRVAAGDALVCQQFGCERTFTRPCNMRSRVRAQRRHARERLTLLERVFRLDEQLR